MPPPITVCAFKNNNCCGNLCHMWVNGECVIKTFFMSLTSKTQGAPAMNILNAIATQPIMMEENELEIS